jgi:hypothetical protein
VWPGNYDGLRKDVEYDQVKYLTRAALAVDGLTAEHAMPWPIWSGAPFNSPRRILPVSDLMNGSTGSRSASPAHRPRTAGRWAQAGQVARPAVRPSASRNPGSRVRTQCSSTSLAAKVKRHPHQGLLRAMPDDFV